MNDNFRTKVTPGKKKCEAVLEPACKTMSITFETFGKDKREGLEYDLHKEKQVLSVQQSLGLN